jgi:hypothetical protein
VIQTTRVAGVLILAAIAVAAATAMNGNAAASGTHTVAFFEDGNNGTLAFIDNRPHSPVASPDSPKARFSLGDQAAFTARLLDHKDGKAVGEMFATETVMAGTRYPRVTNLIHAIVRLHDGQIVIDAVVDERDPAKLRGAVTGGTGTYEGARGTFTTHPGNSGNSDQIVLLP